MTMQHATLPKAATHIDSSRLTARFVALKAANKSGLVTFITAGDPDLDTCAKLLAGLPKAGADIIELGMPFSDPMADGTAIQIANLRAFKAGIKLPKILDLVHNFRKSDTTTPIVLMGYYNPVYIYGVEKFLKDAKDAGADGLIIVDLPPEEDAEMCLPAIAHGLHFIRLITPTTDAKRLPLVLRNASGFLYYVSVTGITGGKAASVEPVRKAIAELHKQSDLPVAVGFGIATPEQAALIASSADAVVVGSAIINCIAAHLDKNGQATPGLIEDVLAFVKTLSDATHTR